MDNYDDYAPVGIYDDEDEKLKRGGYVPVEAPPPTAAPSASVAPPSGTQDLESHITPPHAYAPVAPEAARPQWKDYAPVQQHGWRGVMQHIAGPKFAAAQQDLAQKNYQNAVSDYEAPQKEQQQAAQTEETQARAEALRNPPEKQTAETWKAVPNMVGPNGTVLQESSKGELRWAPGITGVGPMKEPATKPAHITYDAGIPVSVTDEDGKTFDVNDPKLPESLKPLVTAATRAHGQHTKEEADKQAAAFEHQQKMFTERQAAPTMQMKNVAAQASLVHNEMPAVISEIQSMKDDLGPIEGRWNEFMQGKVGLDNPKFAGLRTDLLMMSSAVALMHARGRLPENLREEFDRAINAPKQTAENLVTTLQHIDKWTADNMNTMGGGPRAGEPAGKIDYKPGLVRNGYKFKGGDPTKKENWEQQ